MPVYKIRGPDGKLHTATVPDGTPPDVAQRFIANQLAAASGVIGPTAPINTDPTAGMSLGGKLLASVGSGFADDWTGLKQRVAGFTGTPQEQQALANEVAQKRAIDQQLYKATPGGSIAAAVGQAAPLLVLPGGGAGALGRLGMGAVAGGAAGALAPTTADESAGSNTAWGALGGVAFPAALGVLKSGVQRLLPGQGKRAAAQAIADRIAAKAPQGQGGQALDDVIAQLQTRPTTAPSGIPLTAAQQTANPAIAEAELVSRMKNKPAWTQYDQDQATALAQQVKDATAGAAQLPSLKGTRNTIYTEGLPKVTAAIDPDVWATERAALRQSLEDAKLTPQYSTAGVGPAYDHLASEMDRLGDNFTPAHLAVERANLASKVDGASSNAAKAAPRDAPGTIALKQQVDDTLNNASDGAWQSQILDHYRAASNDVRAAGAAQNVRNTFWDPNWGTANKTAVDVEGQVPRITEAGMRGALGSAEDRAGKLMLDQPTQDALQQTMDVLRRQGVIQNLQRAGTGGGGSATTSNAYSAAKQGFGDLAENYVNSWGTPGKILIGTKDFLAGASNYQADKAAREALQDPSALVDLLRGASPSAAGGSLLDQGFQGAQNTLSTILRRAPSVLPVQSLDRPSDPGY